MILLDTDTVTLFFAGQAPVTERVLASTEIVATSIVTRCEILRGRVEFPLKAADGEQLGRAQRLIEQSDRDLAKLLVVRIGPAAEAEFDRLRVNKKLRKIGRGDLLIAAIALTERATLVTRNVRDFVQVPELRLENWAD